MSSSAARHGGVAPSLNHVASFGWDDEGQLSDATALHSSTQ